MQDDDFPETQRLETQRLSSFTSEDGQGPLLGGMAYIPAVNRGSLLNQADTREQSLAIVPVQLPPSQAAVAKQVPLESQAPIPNPVVQAPIPESQATLAKQMPTQSKPALVPPESEAINPEQQALQQISTRPEGPKHSACPVPAVPGNSKFHGILPPPPTSQVPAQVAPELRQGEFPCQSQAAAPKQAPLESQAAIPKQTPLESQAPIRKQVSLESQAPIPKQVPLESQAPIPKQVPVESQAAMPKPCSTNQAHGIAMPPATPKALSQPALPPQPATQVLPTAGKQADAPTAAAIDRRLRRLMQPNSAGEYKVSEAIRKQWQDPDTRDHVVSLFQKCGFDREPCFRSENVLNFCML